MKNKLIRHIRLIRSSVALTGTLCLAACTVFPEAIPAKLYALDVPPMLTQGQCKVRFAVRPVRLPGFIDRAEVVLAGDNYQVKVSANHLWAAPLSNDITRIVAQGLHELWGASQLMPYPVRQAESPEWIITPEVRRLNITPNQMALELRLSAYRADFSQKESKPEAQALSVGPWTVSNVQQLKATATSEMQATEIASGLSRALSDVVPKLSDEMAKAICR
jgi:uncharacterized lipoprotein YmbA